jgi:hypothetical protein
MNAAEIAKIPTTSTKYMCYEERLEGINQMLADLNTLARRDGCIAAAWVLEFLDEFDEFM